MAEHVFLVSINKDIFDMMPIIKQGFKVVELKKGTHVVNIDKESHPELYDPWIPFDLAPKTDIGLHALIQIIMHLTAMRFNLTREHLIGRSRKRSVCNVRKIAVYLCLLAFRRHNGDVPLEITMRIAANFQRDRTNLVYLNKCVRDHMDTEPEFEASIIALKEKVLTKLPIDEERISRQLKEEGVRSAV